ncbi:hypothetical protein [Prescottella subtropica]|uniref:hypothetical protein n=1 Tax=Prescottella subtropica TaxID=2545757 RepID=UPI0010FA1872|nr:hypothetical protein [Prescottella subtropica]
MSTACGNTGRRPRGRRSKGDRAFVSTRVTTDTDLIIRTIAAETRTPLGDVVGTILMVGVRHAAEVESALDELLPLTRTTTDGQVQFDPANTSASIVIMLGRAPTPVVDRVRELQEALSQECTLPMLITFSALLTVGLRHHDLATFRGELERMYALALDPSLADKMLGKADLPAPRSEQGVMSLMV